MTPTASRSSNTRGSIRVSLSLASDNKKRLSAIKISRLTFSTRDAAKILQLLHSLQDIIKTCPSPSTSSFSSPYNDSSSNDSFASLQSDSSSPSFSDDDVDFDYPASPSHANGDRNHLHKLRVRQYSRFQLDSDTAELFSFH